MLLDKLREKCGVFGVFGHKRCNANSVGLHALQHRGQEGAKLTAYDGKILILNLV